MAEFTMGGQKVIADEFTKWLTETLGCDGVFLDEQMARYFRAIWEEGERAKKMSVDQMGTDA